LLTTLLREDINLNKKIKQKNMSETEDKKLEA